uniref:Uncharacterized protein n=1 Tax=Chelonoidis abingdonii TaxID=106734 RepID=A0A8C0J718_CHEAB
MLSSPLPLGYVPPRSILSCPAPHLVLSRPPSLRPRLPTPSSLTPTFLPQGPYPPMLSLSPPPPATRPRPPSSRHLTLLPTPGQRPGRPVAGPQPRPLSRPKQAQRPRPGPGPTFDHVAVDGGAELLAGHPVPVLPVDDPHLLEEGGLAALARAQQQDLDEALHPPPLRPSAVT